MDMGSIAAAIGSLKTASDLAKAFIGVRDSTVIQGKVIELQSAILAAQSSALAAQSEQFTLLNKVLQLEEEVAKARAWDAEKQKYELKRIYPGIVAYALKPETGGAEPRHWLCPNYETRSVLSVPWEGRTEQRALRLERRRGQYG